jgi:muconolactone delta-isomerase
MATFIVMARFRPGTDMSDVQAVIPEETAQVERLRADGRVGAIHLALSRGVVFLEVLAEDVAGAEETVRSLPMAKWWDLDVYPTSAAPASS